MAKIVVTFNGLVQKEISILKPRLTIGRRPTNDIPIDHLTISGQHAVIDTTSTGSFVLDLGSTNGTMVNGQPIKKHLLQHDDVIDVGKYKLRFQAESEHNGSAFLSDKLTPIKNEPKYARIKVQNGSNFGREMILSKPVTTIGNPAIQVIAITQQEGTYYIAHVDGDSHPLLNEQSINIKPLLLTSGDVIDLSGTKLLFISE
ncbi:FHA domain-containing protein [Undibacterium sp. Rencai35W]|uniref:FHA domain-containing protein n=1 Tax=Undibacterium sp. Rencai35W TaxID=3413046 RepID=UPI003BF40CD6